MRWIGELQRGGRSPYEAEESPTNQPELARSGEGLGAVPCAELAVMLPVWLLTVPTETKRSPATSELVLPEARRLSTSTSRSLNGSSRCSCAARRPGASPSSAPDLGVSSQQTLPGALAQGVGRDAFLRSQFQMSFAGQRMEHLRRFINGERGSHGGRGGGELPVLLQGAKELFLLLPRIRDGTMGLFVRRYRAVDLP